MNIVLIGYRGSGKTSVGKKLADELWKDFVDTDAEICKRFDGATIKQIWDEHGETEFRRVECEVVADVFKKSDQVIALGGGTLMQPAARAVVEAAEGDQRVYLACEAKVLAERIAGDTATAATRPNLTGLGGGVEEVEKVLAERDPIYRAVADEVFDVTHVSIDDAVYHVIRRCL